MESGTKPKKVRLYKVAAELNIGHDVLLAYLLKKGHTLKNHMSIITPEMMDDINQHFKKEKSEAERHARKMREFSEQERKRREALAARQALETDLREEIDAKASVDTESATVEVVAEQEVATEKVATEVETEPVKEPEPEETAETTEPAAEVADIEVTQEELPEKEQVAEAEEKEKPVQEKKEAEAIAQEIERIHTLESSMPKMGLKVKGKLDLDALGKEVVEDEAVGAPVEEAGTVEKPAKKKKKKRKKKKATGEDIEAALLAGGAKRGKKRGREVNMEDVDEAIRRTLTDIGGTSGKTLAKKRKRQRRIEQEIQKEEETIRESKTLHIAEFATVNELANMMNVSAAEVISKLMSLGIMASLNQRLDMDTITLVASDFNFDVEEAKDEEFDLFEDVEDDPETLEPRPPIVTIMGHVDHGKTSLLDHIRDSSVVAGEAGSITQHIGAYMVSLESGKRITFLDTPGHEAFTAMRARGAQVTDIVVLVVAADDSVMPQTLEAISHAQAANVPIIVAINKVDKPDANPERIKQQLADRNILVEDWGGKYGCIELSAKTGLNVDKLLERIALEAEILDLKANPNRPARGVVIEAKMESGKGKVATVLVQKGTLKNGDNFVAGMISGKVRAMFDERQNPINAATPSMPVRVLGFNEMPQAGDVFVAVDSERKAREISGSRKQLRREQLFRQAHRQTLDDISRQIKAGAVRELNLLVKADVDGSVEALSDSLEQLSTDEVAVRVVHRGIGGITESDVLLAAVSNAIIIGFHVRPHLNARKLAELEKVDIRLYEVIYQAIDNVKYALEGLLAPEISEEIVATVEVREVFKISRVGTVAGCYVLDGKITRNSKVRLVRDGVVIFTGGLSTLKRFKDDVREVDSGFECGLTLDGFNDIKVGDVIEAYRIIETKRKLD